MPTFLRAIALANYKAIGPEVQRLVNLSDFNFLIGANNSGKSSVLDFLFRHLNNAIDSNSGNKLVEFTSLDRFSGKKAGDISVEIGLEENEFVGRVKSAIGDSANNPHFPDLMSYAFSVLSRDQYVWLTAADPFVHGFVFGKSVLEHAKRTIDRDKCHLLWTILTGHRGGGFDEHWFPQLLKLLAEHQKISVPRVRLIPAKRQLVADGQGLSDFSGRGVISRLAELQSPDHDRRHELLIFDRINEFVRTVTDSSDARIEVPHNRNHILVHMNDKVLPLASLGTGIHELVLIATFCTICSGEIICVEEPEIHLHPLLQRKLLSYLRQDTNNQYFIATHSASFIDTPGAAIFHVTNGPAQAQIKSSLLRKDKYEICSDLGYRSSDIIQSNFVIWVEGPSDRIYVKHWIRSIDRELLEHTHYSIMFYGGRLLNHLSAHDEEVSDFIGLKLLNRNLAIIMDSDKRKAQSRVNKTKSRIVEELSRERGMAWVTAGREIENYVSGAQMHAALQEVYGDLVAAYPSRNSYEEAYFFETSRKRWKESRRKAATLPPDLVVRDIDKIKLAKAIASKEADLTNSDLKRRIEELVQLIRQANS